MKKILVIFILFLMPLIAYAYGDFEELCKQGYAVTTQTNITGDFEGCDFDKLYKLDNGLILQCNEYYYYYYYRPNVYILQNRYGSYKVIINDRAYNVTLYR